MEKIIQTGQVYPFGRYTMRVLCANGNQVILEKSLEETIVGYVVATDAHMYSGKLVWLNGAHFSCMGSNPRDGTPFEAFQKSWKNFCGSQTVYALVEDTQYGADATVYSTMELAKQALQAELDGNTGIQSIAENMGIQRLTVEAYLDGALSDTPFPVDEYSIVVRVIDPYIRERKAE